MVGSSDDGQDRFRDSSFVRPSIWSHPDGTYPPWRPPRGGRASAVLRPRRRFREVPHHVCGHPQLVGTRENCKALDTAREILPERRVQIFQSLSNFSGELFASHALLTSDTGNPRSANMCARHAPAHTAIGDRLQTKRKEANGSVLIIESHCLRVGLLRVTIKCSVDPGPASTTSFAAFSPIIDPGVCGDA